MNLPMARALFMDALYQVLDNKVFRILGGLCLFMVLCTFAIGARSEELVILFGWVRIPYRDIFAFFDMPFPGLELAGQLVVQSLQKIFVDFAAGVLGIFLAVAATAFFVPRLLEKGAADTVFSKPVSRLTLLLSRYVAGLLFVALLAVLLVGGMHVGFLVGSGYSDPGFLWSALTLVYVFGVLHGVSLLVGVFTRSTVAAILVTMLFWTFNGCVHTGWSAKEASQDIQARREAAASERPAARKDAPEQPDDGQPPQATGTPESEEEDPRWMRALITTLDVLHYTLPKTADATLIAQKLRHQIKYKGYELLEEATGLQIQAPPAGFTRQGTAADLDGKGVVWLPAGGEDGRSITLRRQPAQRRAGASDAIRAEVASRPGASAITTSNKRIAGKNTIRLEWTEETAERTRRHRIDIFRAGPSDYLLEVVGEPEWFEDPLRAKPVEEFIELIAFGKGPNSDNPMEYYDYRFGWTAPLKYNIFFSIGSTLAFLLVVLGLAWWRLEHVDF